jgi:hypothetical protein
VLADHQSVQSCKADVVVGSLISRSQAIVSAIWRQNLCFKKC